MNLRTSWYSLPLWNTRTQRCLASLVIALLISSATLANEDEGTAPSNPMIHAQGTTLVDGDGNPIKLRGVLLEGWLMWNGPTWGTGLSSESRIAERIKGIVGSEVLDRFRTEVYDHFITERDIEMIAALGLNMVRVPINHSVLEETGKPIDYSEPGWAYLDRMLDWCEAHDIYAVLDLHALPGGQSGVFVSDPDKEHVWQSEVLLARTVEIWKAIASRYRDRTIVAGYDLVNEPEPPTGADLVDLHRRIIAAIRGVDPNHLVILEGGAPASGDFSIYEGPLDSNQAYGFHTYSLFTNSLREEALKELVRIGQDHQVPLWNGEFGAHTAEWVRGQIELFEDPANHINGWTFWPWKRLPESSWGKVRYRDLMGIQTTENWDTVRKFIASIFGAKKIPPEVAHQALADFVEAIKAENLVADQEMIEVLQSWRVETPKEAASK